MARKAQNQTFFEGQNVVHIQLGLCVITDIKEIGLRPAFVRCICIRQTKAPFNEAKIPVAVARDRLRPARDSDLNQRPTSPEIKTTKGDDTGGEIRLAELATQLSTVQEEFLAVKAQLNARDAELEKTRTEIAGLESARDTALERAKRADGLLSKSQSNALEATIQEQKARLSDLTAQLAEAVAEKVRLGQANREAERRAGESVATQTTMRSELILAGANKTSLETEVARLTAQVNELAAAKAEAFVQAEGERGLRMEAEVALNNVKNEASSLQAEITRLEGDLTDQAKKISQMITDHDLLKVALSKVKPLVGANSEQPPPPDGWLRRRDGSLRRA